MFVVERLFRRLADALLAGAEHEEVLRGFWCLAVVERERDAPLGPAADADVHPAGRARHRFCLLVILLQSRAFLLRKRSELCCRLALSAAEDVGELGLLYLCRQASACNASKGDLPQRSQKGIKQVQRAGQPPALEIFEASRVS